MIENDMC